MDFDTHREVTVRFYIPATASEEAMKDMGRRILMGLGENFAQYIIDFRTDRFTLRQGGTELKEWPRYNVVLSNKQVAQWVLTYNFGMGITTKLAPLRGKTINSPELTTPSITQSTTAVILPTLSATYLHRSTFASTRQEGQ